MATYEYRCPRDGDFEVRLPLGEAGATLSCPACQGRAARVWSAPGLARTPRALGAALDGAARSAETPEVVSRIPGGRPAVAAPAHPARARLPRL
ncbi:zinc ribbon domain-containing protein [Micromonospora sp. 15K316]|uniref:FmdB family zinc ribbon protein n=1 Tax=Micromonospora sp. 15K316 TaxID=2530376 RepID=UPI00104E880F|nr:FmdB family zinc ribbon protein [Micromonospora sp. 15K316]TDC34372.1 zinc ribbon domain-containing protein [Micromonospora sp. 15K316]